MAHDHTDAPEPRRRSTANWIMLPLILLLVATQAWMYDRASRLERALIKTQTQVVVLSDQIDALANQLDYVTVLAENADRHAHTHW
jgi:hypothetical protein